MKQRENYLVSDHPHEFRGLVIKNALRIFCLKKSYNLLENYLKYIWNVLKNKFLFLLKHKLELMFSSIDPCVPRIGIFLAIDFPHLELQRCTLSPSIVIGQSKDWSAHAFRSSANQLLVASLCSCMSTLIAVDLHSQLVSCSTQVFICPPTILFQLTFPGVTILRRSSLYRRLHFICFILLHHIDIMSFSIQKKLFPASVRWYSLPIIFDTTHPEIQSLLFHQVAECNKISTKNWPHQPDKSYSWPIVMLLRNQLSLLSLQWDILI